MKLYYNQGQSLDRFMLALAHVRISLILHVVLKRILPKELK